MKCHTSLFLVTACCSLSIAGCFEERIPAHQTAASSTTHRNREADTAEIEITAHHPDSQDDIQSSNQSSDAPSPVQPVEELEPHTVSEKEVKRTLEDIGPWKTARIMFDNVDYQQVDASLSRTATEKFKKLLTSEATKSGLPYNEIKLAPDGTFEVNGQVFKLYQGSGVLCECPPRCTLVWSDTRMHLFLRQLFQCNSQNVEYFIEHYTPD